MIHMGIDPESGKRCLIGTGTDWQYYMFDKSDKSLYYYLRRNGYLKDYLCSVLSDWIDEDNGNTFNNSSEAYDYLMQHDLLFTLEDIVSKCGVTDRSKINIDVIY